MMKRLGQLVRLPAAERADLVEAVALGLGQVGMLAGSRPQHEAVYARADVRVDQRLEDLVVDGAVRVERRLHREIDAL